MTTREELWDPANVAGLRRLSSAELSIRIGLLEKVTSIVTTDEAPLLARDGGVNDQIEILRLIRAERIPPIVIQLKTLDVRAEQAKLGE